MTTEAQRELVHEAVKADLTAPRILLEQVENYIRDHYGFSGPDLKRFFDEKYPELEDYEIDLTFSPQFTPTEANRLPYMPILGRKHLTPDEVTTLCGQLVDEHLSCTFSTPDTGIEVSVPLRDVMIERYVKLLKLDHGLDEAVYEAIESHVPEDAWNVVNLLARDDVWQSPDRRQMLNAFLRVFRDRNSFRTDKIRFLTNFVRTYRPQALADVERQLESLIKSCETDMENVKNRGFHDEYLKAMYLGNEMTGASEAEAWQHYHHMMGMAKELLDDFRQITAEAR